MGVLSAARPGCRVGAMSKVELAGRPEPGYESMEQFSVSVEHVADMLRTIDFQPGEGGRGPGCPDPPAGVGGGAGRRPEPRGHRLTGLPPAQARPGRKRTRRWRWTEKRAAQGPRRSGRKVRAAGGAAGWAVPSSRGRPPCGAGTRL